MGATPGEAVLGRQSAGVPARVLRRLRGFVLFPFIGLLAFIMAYPIFMVVYASFKGGPPGVDAPFSLQGYTNAWTDAATYRALITTFALAVPRVAVGVVFAVFSTWIITRTNTPLRGLMEELIWLRIFLPPLPMLLAWLLLMGGSQGVINKFLMDTFNLTAPPLDIQSYWGVIFNSFMMAGTFMFLYMAPAFRNMDASLEESSRVSGASNLTTLWRITVPIMRPAILGITLLQFLVILGSYENELFLLAAKGKYVLSTWIWWQSQKMPPDYPTAMAMSSVFLIFVAVVIFFQFKLLGKRQYTTVTGRGFGVRLLDLGRWRWATFALMMSWTVVGLILPMTMLIFGTFLNSYSVLDSGLTLQYWKQSLAQPTVMKSIKNTLFLGFMVATMGVVLYGAMSYIYLRTKLRGRQAIEALSWVPRAAPSVVLGLGIVWVVLGGGIPGLNVLYGTLFIMAFVILLEATPQGMRMMNGGMVQLSAELEEASKVSGASWLRTMRRVVMPLLMPTLLNAWLLSFLGATRALVVLLFIYMPASRVLSIDIFTRALSTRHQEAAILGVILTIISMVVAIVARVLALRERRLMEVTGAA